MSNKNNTNDFDLSWMLYENKVLMISTLNSMGAINNFLRGWVSGEVKAESPLLYNPDEANSKLKAPLSNQAIANNYVSAFQSEMRNKEIQAINAGMILFEDVAYNPVTIEYIKEIIQLDVIFRASKYWNTKSKVVYRGVRNADGNDKGKINLNALVFASPDLPSALIYADDMLLKINLPQNFPYINPYKCLGMDEDRKQANPFQDMFGSFEEVMLPPCDFEIVGNWNSNFEPLRWKKIEKPNLKMIEINVKPKSLAKVFLERMNNLPQDYPKTYVNNQFYQFSQAKQMLEMYVKMYVDKNLIPTPFGILPEMDEPPKKQKQPE